MHANVYKVENVPKTVFAHSVAPGCLWTISNTRHARCATGMPANPPPLMHDEWRGEVKYNRRSGGARFGNRLGAGALRRMI